MRVVLRFARGTASLVASTVGTSLFCNIAMADQYLSIMLASSMFKDTYRERGYESRLRTWCGHTDLSTILLL